MTIYKCWKKLLLTEYRDATTRTDEVFVSLTRLDFDNVGVETHAVTLYGSDKTTQEIYLNLQKINGFENVSYETAHDWITRNNHGNYRTKNRFID